MVSPERPAFPLSKSGTPFRSKWTETDLGQHFPEQVFELRLEPLALQWRAWGAGASLRRAPSALACTFITVVITK